MRYAPLLIIAAVSAGCVSHSTAPAFSELPDCKPPDPYEALRARRLVPGDRFPLRIGFDPPTVVDVAVDPDGYIELPQIGRLHVAGMLGTEMEKAVAAGYQKRGITLHGMVRPGVVQ